MIASWISKMEMDSQDFALKKRYLAMIFPRAFHSPLPPNSLVLFPILEAFQQLGRSVKRQRQGTEANREAEAE